MLGTAYLELESKLAEKEESERKLEELAEQVSKAKEVAEKRLTELEKDYEEVKKVALTAEEDIEDLKREHEKTLNRFILDLSQDELKKSRRSSSASSFSTLPPSPKIGSTSASNPSPRNTINLAFELSKQ
ncbi:7199_t:CDS:2, partial [Funneliformis geosporum]